MGTGFVLVSVKLVSVLIDVRNQPVLTAEIRSEALCHSACIESTDEIHRMQKN